MSRLKHAFAGNQDGERAKGLGPNCLPHPCPPDRPNDLRR